MRVLARPRAGAAGSVAIGAPAGAITGGRRAAAGRRTGARAAYEAGVAAFAAGDWPAVIDHMAR